jgi:thymidine kinase
MTKARSVKLLSELGDSYRHYDVIGIDEGQFFKDVSNTVYLKSK